MKKLPLLFLLIAIVSCVHHPDTKLAGYESNTPDSLSAISSEIAAIPLETNAECRISHLKQIKCTVSDLLILSNNDIYFFDRSGSYKSRLFFDKGIIESFTYNPLSNQILLVANQNELHAYSPDGTGFNINEYIQTDFPWERIFKIEYYNHHYWIIAENLSGEGHFKKCLYKLNLDYQLKECTALQQVDLGRNSLNEHLSHEVSIYNREIYAYTPSCFKETVLKDSVYFATNHMLNNQVVENHAIPFRLDTRYLVSYCLTNFLSNTNYIYFYDRQTQTPYGVNGLNDDLCHTGLITNFQATDLYSNQYCFYKSGDEVGGIYPERNKNDNPVLFFIKLNA